MPLSDFNKNSLTRTIPRPLKRIVVPIFAVMFGFCALCTYVLIDARRTTLERASETAVSLVTYIAADISRTIETVDSALEGVADALNRPDIEQLAPELRRLFVFDRSTTPFNLGRIFVTNAAGDVVLSSKDPKPPVLNLADRDFFQAHKANSTSGVSISAPAISRTNGGYSFVAISRRLSNADGSFAGMVSASMRLSYLKTLFEKAALGPDGSIILVRMDGTVLMRWPYKDEYIGANIQGAKLHQLAAKSYSGSFESSAIDGLNRQLVYSRVGNLPLVIGVGQTTSGIYAQWYEYAFTIAFLMLLLCTVAFALANFLIYELSRRKEAEAKLAILASTDGLTSLANRRHFNSTLDIEWQRATRDRSSLSLMMIDADNFKIYNDTRGHQAGDIMLNTLGAAIVDASARASDMGARFGGDEFAILLPATPLEGAELVAEKLRAGFVGLCEQEGMTPIGLSIGLACAIPNADMKPSELIALADLALYRAKELGRNRTEVAARSAEEPAAAKPPADHQAA